MASRKKSHRSKKGLFKKGIKTLQKTSTKIMPRLKTSIEAIGNKVTASTIPSTKRSIASLFGLKGKTKKRRSRKR